MQKSSIVRVFGGGGAALSTINKRFCPFGSGLASQRKKNAFTLAEVLITLGIIGVVAALTLPALIQSNKNIEIEAKLKKIYSAMNQAIILSEADNGPKEYWPLCETTSCRWYYEQYFLPYLADIKHVEFSAAGYYNIAIYFSDGTLLIGKNDPWYYGRVVFFFFPNAGNFDHNTFGYVGSDGTLSREGLGISFWSFCFVPSERGQKFHYKKGFEPFKINLEEFSQDKLEQGEFQCTKNGQNRSYCTALIQLNGWKIPKDYPFKVR